MGFNNHTSYFLKELVGEFILLDDYPNIMRKVTKSEKEKISQTLISNNFVKKIIQQMNKLENEPKYDFVGLSYFRKRLTDYYNDYKTEISDALTLCLDNEILITYHEDSPNDPKHPTTACKLNKDNPAVQYVITKKAL